MHSDTRCEAVIRPKDRCILESVPGRLRQVHIGSITRKTSSVACPIALTITRPGSSAQVNERPVGILLNWVMRPFNSVCNKATP